MKPFVVILSCDGDRDFRVERWSQSDEFPDLCRREEYSFHRKYDGALKKAKACSKEHGVPLVDRV